MSLVQDFIAAIRAIDPAPFRIVGGAADFSAISDAPKATPAAYVLIESEESEPNSRAMGGPVLQRCVAEVAVVIVTRNLTDAKGAAAAVDLEALKTFVRAALIGTVPASSAENRDPVEHVAGELLAARGGVVWHRETFSAVTSLGEAA